MKPEWFAEDPRRLVRIFRIAAEHELRLHPDTQETILAHASRAADLQMDPQVIDDFWALLTMADDGEVLLGDIVLAEGVCVQEAADKGISILDHATHLIVHGTFHLLGYDHMDDAEAEAMEALEIAALASLGLADPYGDRNDI